MSTAVEREDEVELGVRGRRAPSTALLSELETESARFESLGPLDVLAWATERFGDELVLATSFQDCVLVDLAIRVNPTVHVVFLDTGFHFPETLAYAQTVKDRYNLNLEVIKPAIGLDVWPCGSANCCEFRKVTPLNVLLATKSAWVTGVKRVDTPERADAPIVGWDSKGLVKVNPIATWTEDDVEQYVEERELPHHPLNALGYASIGCAPTTRPIEVGENPRVGRWSESGKTECGLHL